MTVQELLDRKYNGGTTVINCITHMNLDFTNRPHDCNLCQTDIRNELSRCISINKWLDQWREDAVRLFAEGT